MKRILVSLALIVGIMVTQSLADQPASKIVDRFKKASGGKFAAPGEKHYDDRKR